MEDVNIREESAKNKMEAALKSMVTSVMEKFGDDTIAASKDADEIRAIVVKETAPLKALFETSKGDDDKDSWCTENCLNPGAPSCPPTTGDGGGCDCNCKHGDSDCPGE